LIPVVTSITYPEVGEFIQKYIVNAEDLDYLKYLEKVGVEPSTYKTPVLIALMVGNKPYMKVDQVNKQFLAMVPDGDNEFVNAMGLQNEDVILEINQNKVDVTDIMSTLLNLYKLPEGKPMVIKVNRKGEVIELKGNVKLNYIDAPGYKFTNPAKKALKDSWLKG
jgi:predicted metalloprotease with PDZ domain